MYLVRVKSHFSSAHNLRGYKGKCEDLHGHNWNVELVAQARDLDNTGMVVDFTDLKKTLKGCVDELDHTNLNNLDHFREVNPTSENIARYIFEKVSGKSGGIDIREVTVWETDSSSATYSAS